MFLYTVGFGVILGLVVKILLDVIIPFEERELDEDYWENYYTHEGE